MKKYFWGVAIFVLTYLLSGGVARAACDPSGDQDAIIKNPLCVNSIAGLIAVLLDLISKIGLVAALMMIIYSGFLFVTARGDTSKLETARKTFLYTVIGAAILLAANVIAGVIGATIKDVGGTVPNPL